MSTDSDDSLHRAIPEQHTSRRRGDSQAAVRRGSSSSGGHARPSASGTKRRPGPAFTEPPASIRLADFGLVKAAAEVNGIGVVATVRSVGRTHSPVEPPAGKEAPWTPNGPNNTHVPYLRVKLNPLFSELLDPQSMRIGKAGTGTGTGAAPHGSPAWRPGGGARPPGRGAGTEAGAFTRPEAATTGTMSRAAAATAARARAISRQTSQTWSPNAAPTHAGPRAAGAGPAVAGAAAQPGADVSVEGSSGAEAGRGLLRRQGGTPAGVSTAPGDYSAAPKAQPPALILRTSNSGTQLHTAGSEAVAASPFLSTLPGRLMGPPPPSAGPSSSPGHILTPPRGQRGALTPKPLSYAEWARGQQQQQQSGNTGSVSSGMGGGTLLQPPWRSPTVKDKGPRQPPATRHVADVVVRPPPQPRAAAVGVQGPGRAAAGSMGTAGGGGYAAAGQPGSPRSASGSPSYAARHQQGQQAHAAQQRQQQRLEQRLEQQRRLYGALAARPAQRPPLQRQAGAQQAGWEQAGREAAEGLDRGLDLEPRADVTDEGAGRGAFVAPGGAAAALAQPAQPAHLPIRQVAGPSQAAHPGHSHPHPPEAASLPEAQNHGVAAWDARQPMREPQLQRDPHSRQPPAQPMHPAPRAAVAQPPAAAAPPPWHRHHAPQPPAPRPQAPAPSISGDLLDDDIVRHASVTNTATGASSAHGHGHSAGLPGAPQAAAAPGSATTASGYVSGARAWQGAPAVRPRSHPPPRSASARALQPAYGRESGSERGTSALDRHVRKRSGPGLLDMFMELQSPERASGGRVSLGGAVSSGRGEGSLQGGLSPTPSSTTHSGSELATLQHWSDEVARAAAAAVAAAGPAVAAAGVPEAVPVAATGPPAQHAAGSIAAAQAAGLVDGGSGAPPGRRVASPAQQGEDAALPRAGAARPPPPGRQQLLPAGSAFSAPQLQSFGLGLDTEWLPSDDEGGERGGAAGGRPAPRRPSGTGTANQLPASNSHGTPTRVTQPDQGPGLGRAAGQMAALEPPPPPSHLRVSHSAPPPKHGEPAAAALRASPPPPGTPTLSTTTAAPSPAPPPQGTPGPAGHGGPHPPRTSGDMPRGFLPRRSRSFLYGSSSGAAGRASGSYGRRLRASVLMGLQGMGGVGADGALRGSASDLSDFSTLSGPQADVLYPYPSHGYVERVSEHGRWGAAMLDDLDLYDSLQLPHASVSLADRAKYLDPTYSSNGPAPLRPDRGQILERRTSAGAAEGGHKVGPAALTGQAISADGAGRMGVRVEGENVSDPTPRKVSPVRATRSAAAPWVGGEAPAGSGPSVEGSRSQTQELGVTERLRAFATPEGKGANSAADERRTKAHVARRSAHHISAAEVALPNLAGSVRPSLDDTEARAATTAATAAAAGASAPEAGGSRPPALLLGQWSMGRRPEAQAAVGPSAAEPFYGPPSFGPPSAASTGLPEDATAQEDTAAGGSPWQSMPAGARDADGPYAQGPWAAAVACDPGAYPPVPAAAGAALELHQYRLLYGPLHGRRQQVPYGHVPPHAWGGGVPAWPDPWVTNLPPRLLPYGSIPPTIPEELAAYSRSASGTGMQSPGSSADASSAAVTARQSSRLGASPAAAHGGGASPASAVGSPGHSLSTLAPSAQPAAPMCGTDPATQGQAPGGAAPALPWPHGAQQGAGGLGLPGPPSGVGPAPSSTAPLGSPVCAGPGLLPDARLAQPAVPAAPSLYTPALAPHGGPSPPPWHQAAAPPHGPPAVCCGAPHPHHQPHHHHGAGSPAHLPPSPQAIQRLLELDLPTHAIAAAVAALAGSLAQVGFPAEAQRPPGSEAPPALASLSPAGAASPTTGVSGAAAGGGAPQARSAAPAADGCAGGGKFEGGAGAGVEGVGSGGGGDGGSQAPEAPGTAEPADSALAEKRGPPSGNVPARPETAVWQSGAAAGGGGLAVSQEPLRSEDSGGDASCSLDNPLSLEAPGTVPTLSGAAAAGAALGPRSGLVEPGNGGGRCLPHMLGQAGMRPCAVETAPTGERGAHTPSVERTDSASTLEQFQQQQQESHHMQDCGPTQRLPDHHAPQVQNRVHGPARNDGRAVTTSPDGPLHRAVRLLAQSVLIVVAGAAGATAAASTVNAVFMRPEDLPDDANSTSIYYHQRQRQSKWRSLDPSMR